MQVTATVMIFIIHSFVKHNFSDVIHKVSVVVDMALFRLFPFRLWPFAIDFKVDKKQ